MKELIRNPDTGALEVWENGEKIGEIITMGDKIKDDSAKGVKEFEQDTGNQPQEKR